MPTVENNAKIILKIISLIFVILFSKQIAPFSSTLYWLFLPINPCICHKSSGILFFKPIQISLPSSVAQKNLSLFIHLKETPLKTCTAGETRLSTTPEIKSSGVSYLRWNLLKAYLAERSFQKPRQDSSQSQWNASELALSTHFSMRN